MTTPFSRRKSLILKSSVLTSTSSPSAEADGFQAAATPPTVSAVNSRLFIVASLIDDAYVASDVGCLVLPLPSLESTAAFPLLLVEVLLVRVLLVLQVLLLQVLLLQVL